MGTLRSSDIRENVEKFHNYHRLFIASKLSFLKKDKWPIIEKIANCAMKM